MVTEPLPPLAARQTRTLTRLVVALSAAVVAASSVGVFIEQRQQACYARAMAWQNLYDQASQGRYEKALAVLTGTPAAENTGITADQATQVLSAPARGGYQPRGTLSGSLFPLGAPRVTVVMQRGLWH